VISEERLELNLERAAHRETRAYLARMTQAAQYWQTKATNDGPATDGLPIPDPLPTSTPVPDGGGVVVLVVVSELMEATAQLARQLALRKGGVPPGTYPGEWVAHIQNHVDRLREALGGR
jgi:hypothetical protein